MSALKSANKELKGVMKTVNISDIDVCCFYHCIAFTKELYLFYQVSLV